MSENKINRAAAKTLLRLKRETVMRQTEPMCAQEWECCRDIIAEEMAKIARSSEWELAAQLLARAIQNHNNEKYAWQAVFAFLKVNGDITPKIPKHLK